MVYLQNLVEIFSSGEGNSVSWRKRDGILVPQHNSHEPASRGKKVGAVCFLLLTFLSSLGYIPVEKDGRTLGRKD